MKDAAVYLGGTERTGIRDNKTLARKTGDGVSAEEQMVTRLGLEPRTPGLKVPEEGMFPEEDGERQRGI